MSAKRAIRVVGTAAGVGLVAAAVGTELRKPRRKRTWHGRIAGVVPYDFRPPTRRRVKARWWNPNDPRVLTPRAFGVGWDVNVGRLVRH
jgi:Family of unknown function (DUF5808)